MRIEFPKDLARFQTPQTMFRGSKTPTRPRNIKKSKNRSFFERFQGPPGSPWSLSKVVIGYFYISLDVPWPLDSFLDLSVPPRVRKVQKSDFFATKVKVEPKVKVIIVQTRMDSGPQ